MRVVIVNKHPADALGGSEIQCGLIAEGLHRRGHSVSYVAPGAASTFAPDVGYRVVPTAAHATAISRAIAAEAPEVVYWRFNRRAFRPVARELHRQTIPMVFAVSHVNDVRPWSTKPRSGWRARLRAPIDLVRGRWHHAGFRYVRSLTSLNSEYLGIAPVAEQHFVPNAMVEEGVAFSWPRPFIAWIANVKPAKRPEAAVRLAERLRDSGVDVLMAGAIQSHEYAWLADDDRRPSNCHYLGPLSPLEVNGMLAASVLHVHTCQPEGFGNVFIQAWLQGRPSVSLGFDPGGTIEAEGIGYDCRDDVDLFHRMVLRLLSDRHLREAAGERARRFALRTFGVERMVAQVEAIIASARRS